MCVLPLLLSLTVGATLGIPVLASGPFFSDFYWTLVSLWHSVTCHYIIHPSRPLPCGSLITLHRWEVGWCFWCVSHIHVFDTLFQFFMYNDGFLMRLNLQSCLVLDVRCREHTHREF
jgi:hypothetical protein